MRRIKDGYLEAIERLISLKDKRVLEVGCGDGTRTVQIAGTALDVIAVEPDTSSLAAARANNQRSNVTYLQGSADALPADDAACDVVLFTLSFHHVPTERMKVAIDEALRVVKPDGRIVFLEPAFEGTFFEAEIAFDACDGDERKEKAAAYAAMLAHEGLKEEVELSDETVFAFDSVDDFIASMHPKKGTREAIERFLSEKAFTLNAKRRINVFRPSSAAALTSPRSRRPRGRSPKKPAG